jgi:DNA-binding CsgD family transcriptional regulator
VDQPARFAEYRLSGTVARAIVEQLGVAVFVFRNRRLGYANKAAQRLTTRLRARYNVEFLIVLSDHLAALGNPTPRGGDPTVSLVTAHGGEPFHLHAIPLGRQMTALVVREVGTDMDSFRRRYRLSVREAQVAELVLHGHRNRDIATALGITPDTAKKHLSRVFDKVGVESRVQLVNRLA